MSVNFSFQFTLDAMHTHNVCFHDLFEYFYKLCNKFWEWSLDHEKHVVPYMINKTLQPNLQKRELIHLQGRQLCHNALCTHCQTVSILNAENYLPLSKICPRLLRHFPNKEGKREVTKVSPGRKKNKQTNKTGKFY